MLAFLILALTLSLAVPKVFAADMPMEPPIATLPPPSDTQGQTNLPDLPTLKETKNKKGDAILSWGNKLRKIEIQSLVPDSLSPEDKQIAYGYIQDYSLAINDPGAAKFHVSRALSGGYLPGVSIERNTAFLMGVKAALEQDLVFQILQALGALKPITPADRTPTSPNNPPPSGPMLP
jgi:hypothetical protein